MNDFSLPSFSTQKDKLAVIISLMKTENFIKQRIQGDFYFRIVETIKNTFVKNAKKNPRLKKLITKSLIISVLGNPTKQKVFVDVIIEQTKIISIEYPFEVLIKPYMENCLNLDIEDKLEEYIQQWLQQKTILDKIKNFLLKFWW